MSENEWVAGIAGLASLRGVYRGGVFAPQKTIFHEWQGPVVPKKQFRKTKEVRSGCPSDVRSARIKKNIRTECTRAKKQCPSGILIDELRRRNEENILLFHIISRQRNSSSRVIFVRLEPRHIEGVLRVHPPDKHEERSIRNYHDLSLFNSRSS